MPYNPAQTPIQPPFARYHDDHNPGYRPPDSTFKRNSAQLLLRRQICPGIILLIAVRFSGLARKELAY